MTAFNNPTSGPSEPNHYTVEPHGNGWAIYYGRDRHHHGLNLGHLTESDEAMAKKIERALNHLEGTMATGNETDQDEFSAYIAALPRVEVVFHPRAVDGSFARDFDVTVVAHSTVLDHSLEREGFEFHKGSSVDLNSEVTVTTMARQFMEAMLDDWTMARNDPEELEALDEDWDLAPGTTKVNIEQDTNRLREILEATTTPALVNGEENPFDPWELLAYDPDMQRAGVLETLALEGRVQY